VNVPCTAELTGGNDRPCRALGRQRSRHWTGSVHTDRLRRKPTGHGKDEQRGHDDQPPPPLSPPGFPNENLGRLFSHHFNGTHFRLYAHGATIDSIIPHVKVDRSESLALHDQVAAEIRRAIADGEAVPGERMPPAKDLAAVLGVNSNTVLRALRLLREEGLLEFRRGRGVTVAGTPERTAVIVRARELVDFARRQGFRSNELIEIIEDLP
jgi:GntR family transcriptional regulator